MMHKTNLLHPADRTRYSPLKFHHNVKIDILLGVAAFSVILATVYITVLLSPPYSDESNSNTCTDPCRLTLVETIPQNLTYPDGSPSHMDTYESWIQLIDNAKTSINIGSFYWTMRGEDIVKDPSAWKGEKIFNKLIEVGKTGNMNLRVVENKNINLDWMKDTEILVQEEAAEVRIIDFEKLNHGGILHTKMWLTDDQHFYVGSANMDWRSLSQVKELGIMVTDCGCMANDLQKVFSTYWILAKKSTVPSHWPSNLETNINMKNPMTLEMGGLNETMYISVAPPQLLPSGRTSDLDALLHIIDSAEKFIYIALMDYFPTTLYMEKNIYWPIIDDRLRAAAFERGVEVRLMPSWWRYSRNDTIYFLKSLNIISPAVNGSIEVKLFEVPIVTPAQEKIPYSRVNHNKYMVTETTAFIGTSNWSGDYFLNTAGISIILSQTVGSQPCDDAIHTQLRAIFERDWNSPYAKNLSDFN